MYNIENMENMENSLSLQSLINKAIFVITSFCYDNFK